MGLEKKKEKLRRRKKNHFLIIEMANILTRRGADQRYRKKGKRKYVKREI